MIQFPKSVHILWDASQHYRKAVTPSDSVLWVRLCDSVNERRRNRARYFTRLIRRFAHPRTRQRVRGVGKFVGVPRISHAAFRDHP